MSEAAERHERLVTRLRANGGISDRVVEAFARVPRHHFLPDVPLERVYKDDAIVTRDEGGMPTSSSSQPSLMGRMIDQLDLRPGDRVLEVGTGTGYNAAIMADLGAAVTTVDLQPDIADAARTHIAAAGVALVDEAVEPGAVRVVAGDGAAPPAGPYDRAIVTAGCWALPGALVDSLADGGVLVAPVRVNGIELSVGLRREGAALAGKGALPCGFMPMRGGEQRPWRWELGGGGYATADADLGVEGRGALDRLLATEGRKIDDPIGLAGWQKSLGALLWLGLQGDPLLGLALPHQGDRPPWTLGLDVLPASLLVIELEPGDTGTASATLYGGEGALRTCAAGMESWRKAGSPDPGALELKVEPHSGRDGWSLPYRTGDGAATMVRGAHRWTLRYAV